MRNSLYNILYMELEQDLQRLKASDHLITMCTNAIENACAERLILKRSVVRVAKSLDKENGNTELMDRLRSEFPEAYYVSERENDNAKELPDVHSPGSLPEKKD